MNSRNITVGIVILVILLLTTIAASVLRSQFSRSRISNAPAKNTSNTSSSSDQSTWKTYTNSKFNVAFKYPANWELNEKVSGPTLITINLKSPNNLNMDLSAGLPGVGGRCDSTDETNVGSEKVSLSGKNFNMFFLGDKAKNLISFAYLLEASEPCPNIPYFNIPKEIEGPGGIKITLMGSVKIYYPNMQLKSEAEFKSNDFEIAKQILNTFEI